VFLDYNLITVEWSVREITICEFSALWSHFAFGIKEPLDFRRNGASGFPA